ncbi:hypothetical protein EJ04DRAFT_454808 [Polyplosphaeria fusca]|uniref:Zn(2)-C6 fungal-type domain-containing protein n=1 Tax=Polyplosphaeria fusca TaxID=682080 RepID=A0A9P4V8H3_9PLEO|nr:hypothetical protein EJ04DRAFT_454808 [Polyplosphaeria fusca]
MQSNNSRRRDKPILSCTFCRGRKLKCDRQSPCGVCVRRSKPADCIYTCTEQERKEAIDYRPHGRGQRARQRIARLENLVSEIASSTESTATSRESHLGPSSGDDQGKLSLNDNLSTYTGSSHWATILEDIRHLKDELNDDASNSNTTSLDGLMQGSPTTRISLLNSAPCLPKEQILSMLPPRKVVDRHISHFFNTFEMAPFLINRKRFLAEYADFWRDPSAAPIMWLAYLFSVMTMSVLLQRQDGGAEAQELLETYRTLTIHCLIAGDYLRPSRYTIETLTLHFGVDQNLNVDASIGNWILIGVVIRIALRMGLHRDPSHWSIRPMQAELRRRQWLTLYQMDFFTSTQVGLPRIIKDSQSDTRVPAHLFDQDLGYEHDEMPPERPFTEQTPLMYMIQRHAIIKVAAEIYDATEAGPPSRALLSTLSAKLQVVIETIPPWLKYRPLETSIAESHLTIIASMFLDILVHKATYLLYRRSFVNSSTRGADTTSNEQSIKAALAILAHQRRIEEETQPGGLMFGARWKISTSLNHEFLQATMMLCFALTKFDSDWRKEIIQALVTAKSIWEKIVDRSVEAQRAAKVIEAVLRPETDKNTPSAPMVPAFPQVADSFFDPMPGVTAQSYFGGFDYPQTMPLDPSIFTFDNDPAAFGGMFDDFVTGSMLNSGG